MSHEYLDLATYLEIAEEACGHPVAIFNKALLLSVLGRPEASAFGGDAYADTWSKAAAMLQSLACNHGLVDGNKRSALMATLYFIDLNGSPIGRLDEDEIVDFTVKVATSAITDIEEIAAYLEYWCCPHGRGR